MQMEKKKTHTHTQIMLIKTNCTQNFEIQACNNGVVVGQEGFP